MEANFLSVVFSDAVKLSYEIKLSPCRPSRAHRPASYQQEFTDLGHPM